ncbi:MAG TPA: hypothetical protein VFL14_02215 [Xanthomonadales bacterium]|nr:hypothetical protein [Xanthomonadales bacterium]
MELSVAELLNLRALDEGRQPPYAREADALCAKGLIELNTFGEWRLTRAGHREVELEALGGAWAASAYGAMGARAPGIGRGFR